MYHVTLVFSNRVHTAYRNIPLEAKLIVYVNASYEGLIVLHDTRTRHLSLLPAQFVAPSNTVEPHATSGAQYVHCSSIPPPQYTHLLNLRSFRHDKSTALNVGWTILWDLRWLLFILPLCFLGISFVLSPLRSVRTVPMLSKSHCQ